MSARTNDAAGGERLQVRGHALILGVIVFLSSELMFFAAWFAAYFDLRGRAGSWPPSGVHLDVVEASFGTLLLALSSATAYRGVRHVRSGDSLRARAWLLGTLGCALLFLAETAHGWSRNGFSFATHAYGSLFYGMTGFHAAHVAAGVIALTFLTAGVEKHGFRDAHGAGAEAISYYWHFVFVVWLGIWATIYFVR